MSSPAPPLAHGTNTKRSIGIVMLVLDVTAEKLGRSRLAAGAVGAVSHAASAATAKARSASCFIGHLEMISHVVSRAGAPVSVVVATLLRPILSPNRTWRAGCLQRHNHGTQEMAAILFDCYGHTFSNRRG